MERTRSAEMPAILLSYDTLRAYHPDDLVSWGDTIAKRMNGAQELDAKDAKNLRILCNFVLLGTTPQEVANDTKKRVAEEWLPLLEYANRHPPAGYVQSSANISNIRANARGRARRRF